MTMASERIARATCPQCQSTEVVCDGDLHRCLTCGYDGTKKDTKAEEEIWWRVWQITSHLKDLSHELTVAGYPATAARATDQALFWEEFANQGLPF